VLPGRRARHLLPPANSLIKRIFFFKKTPLSPSMGTAPNGGTVRGVMAIAPRHSDANNIRPLFLGGGDPSLLF
jgi:hypothetical protein